MRNWLLYADEIRRAIDDIEAFVAGMTQEQFLRDRKTQASVLMMFVVIGEAVKKLPSEFKTTHAHIAWKDIAGLRDRVVHAYSGTKVTIIWEAIQTDLKALKEVIQKAQ